MLVCILPLVPTGMNSTMQVSKASPVSRVVILGHSGFIGRHLVRYFSEHSPEVAVIGQALPVVDLTRPEDVNELAEFFDGRTAVLMCAAIKRQLGDNLDTFHRNVT